MPLLENENHELYCVHYMESGNQVKSYQAVYPNASYTSAKSQSHVLHNRPDIKNRIAELRDEIASEIKERAKQTREQTIIDLLASAQEAKAAGSFAAYAKMREMIIRICGFYAPDQVNINNNVSWSLKFPGLDEESNPIISVEGKIQNTLEQDDIEDVEFDENDDSLL